MHPADLQTPAVRQALDALAFDVDDYDLAWQDYLVCGGFPRAVAEHTNTGAVSLAYLRDLAAGRPQDITDLVVLFRRLKIRNPEQAVDIAERLYGADAVVLSEPRESLLLLAESVLARIRRSELVS